MPSIHIKSFGGINTETSARNSRPDIAQIAHNCLLWDGSLRPMAKWVNMNVGVTGQHSINVAADEVSYRLSTLHHARFLNTSSYPPKTVVGLTTFPVDQDRSNIVYQNALTPNNIDLEVGVTQPIAAATGSITFAREYHSNKAINRMYAISAVRDNHGILEESPLTILPNQSAQAVSYEGDTATILAHVYDPKMRENTYIRFYRTLSGLDTGDSVGNEFDTQWFLIGEVRAYLSVSGLNREYKFIDGGSVTTDLLDLYLAGKFYQPDILTYSFFDASESGWLVAATQDGKVSVSEKYLVHAWPTENTLQIDGAITDLVTHYDNAFIGTNGVPYVVALADGEALGLQTNVQPFPAKYECLTGSMDKTAAGAIYASPAGLITLTRESMRNITAGVANGVRPLYKTSYTDETVDPPVKHQANMNFRDTMYGAYYNGKYFGFCQIPRVDNLTIPLGYLYDTGSELDGEHPQQKLVTFDAPDGVVLDHVISSTGINLLTSTTVYSMPFPGMKIDKYSTTDKQCYTWKSKKFVFPGNMTFSAAKIVHDYDGHINLELFVDGCCAYETKVCGNDPFRLPPDLQGVEWEVAVSGTATIHEIHIASSLQELLEDE